jgi:hypothetical protein
VSVGSTPDCDSGSMGSNPIGHPNFMRRVLICGDRNWYNSARIFDMVERENERSPIGVIIEGGAKGADKIGGMAAVFHGIPLLKFSADWKKYGRAAGPIRNQQMLDEGKPTEIWAFHNNIEESLGTKNMVVKALKRDLPVLLVMDECDWWVGRKNISDSYSGSTTVSETVGGGSIPSSDAKL